MASLKNKYDQFYFCQSQKEQCYFHVNEWPDREGTLTLAEIFDCLVNKFSIEETV